jgi:hypothetical protein
MVPSSDEDIPAQALSLSNPLERVLHPRYIGLSGVGKQVWLFWAGLRQQVMQVGLVDAHIGRFYGYIGDVGPLRVSQFANAVHRVMVIKGKQIPSTWGKGIGLPDKLEGTAGIGGENHDVFIRRGVKVGTNEAAGAVRQHSHGL